MLLCSSVHLASSGRRSGCARCCSFFFSSRRRHTRCSRDWSSDVCSSDLTEALRTGTPYELDLQMIRPDGSTRWIIDRGEVLRDAAGQIALLRGTAQDITERKQAEDALRASEEIGRAHV